MSRAARFKLQPAADVCSGLTIDGYTYTYSPDIPYAAMRETVYADIDIGPVYVHLSLTPDEARALAAGLVQAAAQCDEHRARRESLEEIEEQMRDENFDARMVRFSHPDIVYCQPGQLTEAAKAHPGKLIIAEQDEVPA